MLGARENLGQVLLRLADVFARHGSQIDAVKRQAKPGREPAGGQRFAGAARPGEQGAHPGPVAGGGRDAEAGD